MRKLSYLLLISTVSAVVIAGQSPVKTSESPLMEVVEFKWTKKRQPPEKLDPGIPQPAAMVNPATRAYERGTRINQPRGERDPTADTIEARSAEIEKNVREARGPKPVDGFAYKVKIKNGSTRVADVVFWEYQFIDPASPGTLTRRQFLCSIRIDPGKSQDIQAFSLLGPGNVVSAEGSAVSSPNAMQENAVINRVEFVDGAIWRRLDWNFAEIKQTYQRAIAAPWGKEMCRAL